MGVIDKIESEEEMNKLLSSMSAREALEHLKILAWSHKKLEELIPDSDRREKIRASIDFDCGVKAIRVFEAFIMKLQKAGEIS